MQQKAIHVYLKEKVINRQDTQLFFASIFTISLTKLRPNLLSGIATIGIYCVSMLARMSLKNQTLEY